jgi:hypothetical protein
MTSHLLQRLIQTDRRTGSGQILPLFALFIVVLFGMAALAIDVSRAYSDLRFYRATADAASLAGAQDLQKTGTRIVEVVDQEAARGHALESLEQRLGGTATGCGPVSADIIDCSIDGTPFLVTVKTPSPSCSTCDPERSVQVTVRNPTYGLTFARVLGSSEWDVGTTSVSGLVYGSQYAIITLRPPKKTGSTFDVRDITVTGGSVVTVQNGDVGSNANMELDGVGSQMILDSGFKVFHFTNPPLWVPPPAEQKINTLITDPNYRYPLMSGSLGTAPTWDDARTSIAGPGKAVLRADDPVDTSCKTLADSVDITVYTFMSTQPRNKVFCFKPGIYQSGTGAKNATITVGTGEVGLLMSGVPGVPAGVYHLKSGMNIGGRIIGGWQPGAPGVALMFDEAGPGNCSSCIFSGNNAVTIALNAGSKYPPGAAGTAATATVDYDNQLVETSGASSPTPPLVLTILVNKDPDCFVPTSAPFQEPPGCNANKNKTLNIAGGGSLVLEGVQYAPTDNVEISGGSAGTGQVGQIISWTLKYSGGTHINQHYPGGTGNGILRIDAACSSPNEPCFP